MTLLNQGLIYETITYIYVILEGAHSITNFSIEVIKTIRYILRGPKLAWLKFKNKFSFALLTDALDIYNVQDPIKLYIYICKKIRTYAIYIYTYIVYNIYTPFTTYTQPTVYKLINAYYKSEQQVKWN